ncbi:MAG: DUF5916 domain-containing protein [Gemmatimonadota bacterium]
MGPRVLALSALVALLALPAAVEESSAQTSGRRYRADAVRVEVGPQIDGLLDDVAWRSATVIDEFIQQEPDEGAPASERTEIRILYDAEYLYIGVHAFDSDPAGVVATEMRRDSDRILEEDNIQFVFDTFMDSRSAYMFATNPLGAKLEQQVFEEGEGGRRGGSSNVNRDWDGVWDVAARRVPDGWVAEIAIPVVTLRFPPADVQQWGINFMRNIGRNNEQAYWAPISKGYGITRVSLAGTLSGMRALNRGMDLRVKPFVVGGGTSLSENGITDNSMQRDLGLDVKYGITPGLNLDLTLNTDFAQAEVDDERVNLTRFPLFYPEKRDFFLENAGQFNVGSTGSLQRLADLFFSRRIGISASGAHVPILGGARLTGKVGRNNLAIMDVQTDEAFGVPGENFLVARYSRDVFGRSKVGGLVINKQATSGGHFNRTFAGDMTLALHPSLTVNGFVAKTETPGLSGADTGGHIRAGWLDQSWNLYAEHTDLGDNFNAEVGFVPRVGIRTSKAHFEYNPRPGRFGIRVLEPMANVTYTTDQAGRLVTRQFHYMLGTRLDNGAYINVWYNDYFERLDAPFAVRPGIVIQPGDYDYGDWRFSYSSNPARRFYHNITYAPQTFFGGTRTDASASLGFRFDSRLSTEAQYSRNDVDLPAGDFTADIASLRVDYAVSPKMTLRTLTQYNSLTEQWSTSARFHYLYRPGSDFYVVYDELRRDFPGAPEVRDRHLILKLTYLLSR